MTATELQANRDRIASEYRATAERKRAQLAALIARAESSINWDVDWEGDTRVRTFADAKREIEYIEKRLAEAEARALQGAA